MAPEGRKAEIRERVWRELGSHGLIPPFEGAGRAAERLRALPEYRRAKRVMVPPDQAQLQVRINALMDGKELVAASAGLRDGFFLLRREDIPPKDRARACRASGIPRYGRPLSLRELGPIDLMVTGAVAVGLNGGRLGKGKGFFDLEYAILRELGAVGEETPVVAVVDDRQILEEVPIEDGDVAVDLIVTPTRVIRAKGRHPRPRGIQWDRLPLKAIRRMKPLWEMRRGRSLGP